MSWPQGLVPGLGPCDTRWRGWRGLSASSCHCARGRHGKKLGKKGDLGPSVMKVWGRSPNPLVASIQHLKTHTSGGVKSVIINQLVKLHLPGGLCTAGSQQSPSWAGPLGMA